MKCFSIALMALLFSNDAAKGQKVGIGTTNPQAQLDIVSSTTGILIPRMTTGQKNAISNPPKGLMIYDSTLNQLQIAGNGGTWSNVSAAGSDFWQLQFTGSEQMIRSNTPAYRRVLVGDRPIQPAVGFANSPHGAFTIWSKVNSITEFTNYLTMDGRSIQSRSVNATVLGPSFESDLLINPFGGNVGIGNEPTHSRLEVSGTVGASAAMFGVGKAGISIHADNPEIGFNYFYNNGTKTMKAGYAANIGMFPNNGDMYIGTFSGYVSNADFGDINATGYQQVVTIRQVGRVGIGTTFPEAKLHVWPVNEEYLTGIASVGKGVKITDYQISGNPYRSYDHQPALNAMTASNGAAIQVSGPVTVPLDNKDFVFDVFPQNTNSNNYGYYADLGGGIWTIKLTGNNSPLNDPSWPGSKYLFVQPYFVGSMVVPGNFILPTQSSVFYSTTDGHTYFVMNQSPVQTAKPIVRLRVMIIRENPSAGPL